MSEPLAAHFSVLLEGSSMPKVPEIIPVDDLRQQEIAEIAVIPLLTGGEGQWYGVGGPADLLFCRLLKGRPAGRFVGNPEVIVRRCRTVIPLQLAGVPSK